jgi:hypothetical protein
MSMGAKFHHDYRQEPITSQEGRSASWDFLQEWEAMIADQEDQVIRARAAGEPAQLAEARTRLWRLLSKRQGLLDAITAYDQQQEHARQGA